MPTNVPFILVCALGTMFSRLRVQHACRLYSICSKLGLEFLLLQRISLWTEGKWRQQMSWYSSGLKNGVQPAQIPTRLLVLGWILGSVSYWLQGLAMQKGTVKRCKAFFTDSYAKWHQSRLLFQGNDDIFNVKWIKDDWSKQFLLTVKNTWVFQSYIQFCKLAGVREKKKEALALFFFPTSSFAHNVTVLVHCFHCSCIQMQQAGS